VIINGIEYSTDKQIVLRELSSLEIIVPPDGCGSIKIRTSYPDFSIPDVRDDDLLITANFKIPQFFIKPGVQIMFQDSSESIISDINSWSWDFGDGTTSIEPNPSHQYHNSGKYTVTLNVTNNNGSQSTVTKRITVPNVYDIKLQIRDIFGLKVSGEIVNIFYDGNLLEEKVTDNNGELILQDTPEGNYLFEFSNFKEKNIEIYLGQSTTKKIQVMFSKNTIYIVGVIIALLIGIEIFIISSTRKT
jgi:PKD repeat protein